MHQHGDACALQSACTAPAILLIVSCSQQPHCHASAVCHTHLRGVRLQRRRVCQLLVDGDVQGRRRLRCGSTPAPALREPHTCCGHETDQPQHWAQVLGVGLTRWLVSRIVGLLDIAECAALRELLFADFCHKGAGAPGQGAGALVWGLTSHSRMPKLFKAYQVQEMQGCTCPGRGRRRVFFARRVVGGQRLHGGPWHLVFWPLTAAACSTRYVRLKLRHR